MFVSDHDQTHLGSGIPGEDVVSCRLLTVHDGAQALRMAYKLAQFAAELI